MQPPPHAAPLLNWDTGHRKHMDANALGSTAPRRLKVKLLGVVEVILDGRRLRAFNSLRLQRALATIVIRQDLYHRQRLAFELWPDSSERQARTNLRKIIHELRNALPDVAEFIEIDNEVVRWISTGPSEVDVLRFRDALAVEDFDLAARVYGGDLLPACYEEWILDERAKLRGEAHSLFLRLAEEAAGRSDHDATIGHAQRAFELEPTGEAAVRAQMEAHLALGDRAAALRTYHRYAEALDRELGVAPSDRVGALYDRLRGGAVHRQKVRAENALPVAESPFVGRGSELEQLVAAWNRTRDGGAHFVLVTGEPGIGKSRLALELARHVRAGGHPVASARAYEAAGRLPWGPVVDVLRSDAVRSQIDTLDAVWRRELARLLPELVEDATTSGLGHGRDPVQRHRLFDAVNRAITAGERPCLVVLDDLQWCDTETVELIGYVVRSGETAPVLIVGTARAEEVPQGHPLIGLTEALGRDRTVTTVPLDRLDEASTGTLAARIADEDAIEPELARRIWNETEGNPLFVIEALRARITADRSRAIMTPTIRAVLGTRLNQLSEGPRRLAELAAVVGGPFSVDLMASALGVGQEELVDDFDELWRRRIIRDHGLRYDYSHDKLRTVALGMISPARRRQLHRGVAEAIAAHHARDIDAASPRLAAHYDQAGMVQQAVDAYHVAGGRAVAVSALEEATAMFRRALALLAELPPSRDRDALELDIRIALGSPLVALEGYGSHGAHQLYERAQVLCRRLDRAVDPPILRGLGLARLQGCRFEDCQALAHALLDHESPVAKTEGRYLLGVSAFWRGDLGTARSHLRAAIAAYDESHRDEHLTSYAQDPRAVCQVRLAWTDLWSGDLAKADEGARLALDVAADLDHLMTSGYVITYAAIMAAESDDQARLAQILDRAEQVWNRVSMSYLGIVGEALRGWLDVSRGVSGGIDDIVGCVARSRVEGETLHLTYCLLLLARGCARVGDLDRGRVAAREGLAWSERHNQRYLEPELWRIDGELAYRSGEAEAAALSLGNAVDVSSAQGARWLQLRALRTLATCFPDPTPRKQLRELVVGLPPAPDSSAFQAAIDLLGQLD